MKNNPETMKLYHAKYAQANKDSLKQYRAEYYKENKEQIKVQQARYYKKNMKVIKTRVSLWKSLHKDHTMNWKRSRRNILNPNSTKFTVVDFDRLYQIQQGRCKICNRHGVELGKQLVPDHNHKTSLIRGLLCSNCNVGIGLLQDSALLTQRATEYLDRGNNG